MGLPSCQSRTALTPAPPPTPLLGPPQGLGVGFCVQTGPLFLSEIAPFHLRGMFNTLVSATCPPVSQHPPPQHPLLAPRPLPALPPTFLPRGTTPHARP